ncbi:MAG: hypothetical protein LBV80_08165 [Deltaproteobacteria bacterium]|jgi:hypothetical protein|nr:hypothetical protein [Deltaproteobacteria bacterium]
MPEVKNCLNCKHEPEWESRPYSRKGVCKITHDKISITRQCGDIDVVLREPNTKNFEMTWGICPAHQPKEQPECESL